MLRRRLLALVLGSDRASYGRQAPSDMLYAQPNSKVP